MHQNNEGYDTMKNNRVGTTFVTNEGCTVKVIAYNGVKDVTIEFIGYDYVRQGVSWNALQRGVVRNPMLRKEYGVGYFGEGPYKTATKAHNAWHNMMRRCYCQETRDKFPTYEQCIVCDEWHNFQNFAKWYEENYYEIDGQTMCLDKDILIKNNKVYSPETCVIVPQHINKLFTKRQRFRSECCIGVTLEKSGKYKAEHSTNGQHNYLGTYDTLQQAFYAYKVFKENEIKRIADLYKQYLPQQLYDAMYNYEVEIND